MKRRYGVRTVGVGVRAAAVPFAGRGVGATVALRVGVDAAWVAAGVPAMRAVDAGAARRVGRGVGCGEPTARVAVAPGAAVRTAAGVGVRPPSGVGCEGAVETIRGRSAVGA